MFNSVCKKKLGKTFFENQKCNPEIWSEMVQSKTGSTDRKTQKMQGCILNALGTTSKVTKTLLDLENSKNVNI